MFPHKNKMSGLRNRPSDQGNINNLKQEVAVAIKSTEELLRDLKMFQIRLQSAGNNPKSVLMEYRSKFQTGTTLTTQQAINQQAQQQSRQYSSIINVIRSHHDILNSIINNLRE